MTSRDIHERNEPHLLGTGPYKAKRVELSFVNFQEKWFRTTHYRSEFADFLYVPTLLTLLSNTSYSFYKEVDHTCTGSFFVPSSEFYSLARFNRFLGYPTQYVHCIYVGTYLHIEYFFSKLNFSFLIWNLKIIWFKVCFAVSSNDFVQKIFVFFKIYFYSDA